MPMHSVEPVSGADFEKEIKQRKEALKRRLKSLPQDNPIVKAALEEKEGLEDRKDKQDKWEVVENLQFTAYNEYFDEDMDFKTAVKSLAEALRALVS